MSTGVRARTGPALKPKVSETHLVNINKPALFRYTTVMDTSGNIREENLTSQPTPRNVALASTRQI